MTFFLRRQLTRLYIRFVMQAPPVSSDEAIPNIQAGLDTSEYRVIASCLATLGAYKSVEDMQKSQVLKIEWYKCTYRLKHEYGVATVERDGITYYIRFERTSSWALLAIEAGAGPFGETVTKHVAPTLQMRREMEDDVRAEKKALLNTPRTSFEKLTTKGSKDKFMSSDTATRVLSPDGMNSNEHGGSILLATYTFAPGTLSLRDLLLTLYEVYTASPNYILLTRQCYWFASTVIGILKENYNPTMSEAEDYPKRGTYWVGVGFKNIRLSYNIHTVDSNEVQRLAGSVQEKVNGRNAALLEAYMNGEGGRLQAEEMARQAKEMARRAEETARQERDGRLQAEEKLMREEKQRLETEEKLVREEKQRLETEEKLAREEKQRLQAEEKVRQGEEERLQLREMIKKLQAEKRGGESA